MSAAYPLFLERGPCGVTEKQIQSAAAVGPLELAEAFASRDEIATECRIRWQRELTIGAVDAGSGASFATPEASLLAIIDVLDGWFQRADSEESAFTDMTDIGDEHPLGQVSIGDLPDLRVMIANLAKEAWLRDVDDFASSWHILMKGAIIGALEGDPDAAAFAKSMARDLIVRHRSLLAVAVSQPMEPADLDTFGEWDSLEEDTDIGSTSGWRPSSAVLADAFDDDDESRYAYAV